MAGIGADHAHPAFAQQIQRSQDGRARRLPMGSYVLIAARQPAKIEHHGLHRSRHMLRHLLMSAMKQRSAPQQTGLLQPCAGVCHSLLLHVKGVYMPAFAHQFAQHLRIVAVAHSRVHRDISGQQKAPQAVCGQKSCGFQFKAARVHRAFRARTSASVRSRHSPRARPRRSIGPNLTRRSSSTLCPTASIMRRTWRLCPS